MCFVLVSFEIPLWAANKHQGPLRAAARLPSVKRDRLQVMPAQSCSICYPCGVTLSLRPRKSNLLQMPIRQVGWPPLGNIWVWV